MHNKNFEKLSAFQIHMIRISYGNLSGHVGVNMLYATDTPAYVARIKFILMNIIRALSTLDLCLLTAPFQSGNPYSHWAARLRFRRYHTRLRCAARRHRGEWPHP